jgi:hypothetical protein
MIQRTLRQDQLPKRVDKPTPDQDQDDPYQIVGLFSEVGQGLRSPQSPDEYDPQEKNERYCSQNDANQLIHDKVFQNPSLADLLHGDRFAVSTHANKSPDY